MNSATVRTRVLMTLVTRPQGQAPRVRSGPQAMVTQTSAVTRSTRATRTSSSSGTATPTAMTSPAWSRASLLLQVIIISDLQIHNNVSPGKSATTTMVAPGGQTLSGHVSSGIENTIR